jgi:hypothetical protein
VCAHWATRVQSPPWPAQVGVLGAPRQAMEACMDGPEGAALMAASAGVTASRGMQRSCTVAIAGKKRCIRDGGRW